MWITGRVLFAKPKSQICSLATRYINRATIVSKYHHGGRLRKAIPCLQPSVPLADLLLCFTRFRLRESRFIQSLLLSHLVPKTNLTTAFSFLYFPSFLFLPFLLSISCSAVNVRGQPAHRPVGPGLEIFVLITLPLEINYALLVRSARTGHACNFRDMWK